MTWEELKATYGEPKKTVHHGSPELDLQEACNHWFSMAYPLVKIRNGMEGIWVKDKRVVGKMKKKGVLQKGFPDIEIIHPNATLTKFMLFIELKNGKKGVQSEEQKAFEDYCNDLGCFQYTVCRSLDDFIKTVTEYLGKGRQAAT